ncbi:MAG: thioesterase family protein [Deltaproteobacteria bacterium]|nr:thioesterase family protein [Deltaproteobacteria bacterium]
MTSHTHKNKNQELIKHVKEIFTNKIPFNKVIGLKIRLTDDQQASIEFKMTPKLIGNFYKKSLHGGVISSVLDVTGGIVAFLGVLDKIKNRPNKEKLDRFSKLGTIDLRVDFLRPGVGKYFKSTGYLLRTGSRVAVTRCELHNDENKLIAVGTATYVVS